MRATVGVMGKGRHVPEVCASIWSRLILNKYRWKVHHTIDLELMNCWPSLNSVKSAHELCSSINIYNIITLQVIDLREFMKSSCTVNARSTNINQQLPTVTLYLYPAYSSKTIREKCIACNAIFDNNVNSGAKICMSQFWTGCYPSALAYTFNQ